MLDFGFQGIGYLPGSTELACISSQKLDVCLFPILCSVTSHWLLEVGHGESICTMEINKCYKSGFFFFAPKELIVNYMIGSVELGGA